VVGARGHVYLASGEAPGRPASRGRSGYLPRPGLYRVTRRARPGRLTVPMTLTPAAPEPCWASGDGAVKVFSGDCLDLMARMPAACADAVVTDPPYGLSFGDSDWDTFGSPAAFGEWCTRWAAGCLRVLKPGGYMLAFGGPRLWHRLAAGIEDAGGEVRDTIMWVYGCLSADTEILTDRGWKPGIEVTAGERVAQWDPHTGQISLAPVQEVFRAPWDGPMRVLRNADTDQLLTPNHRVWHRPRQREMTNGVRRVWWETSWEVAEAGSLSTWNPVTLPVAGQHEGPGIGGEDYAALLGWVWTEGGFDHSGTGVRIYQSSVNEPKVAEIAALMDRLSPHKRYDQSRTYTRRNGQEHRYTAVTWFFTGDLAERVRADLPGKRPAYELLWRMTLSEKQAFLQAAMLGDGSGIGSRSEQFYQQHEDDLTWLQTLLALIGRAGRIGMRSNRPGGAVYLRKGGTTELQARHLRDAWEPYTGEVWCVRVPTGAFVARRAGKVFITGNSGFPKSANVARSVDRALGAAPAPPAPGGGYVPATPEAARFLGWGTGLKPAWEPVIVARRPLDGTVAANALAHGTGGLNIDGCRVPAGGPRPTRIRDSSAPRRPRTGLEVYGKGFGDIAGEPGFTSQGRWPPNLVLGHAEGCRPPGRGDGPGEPAPDWDCTDGCPAAGLDRQAAVLGTAPAARYFPVMIYQPKAPRSERPVLARTAMRLRGDLTDRELAYVLAELKKAGIDAA
jgi:hypothetical protein